MSDNGDTFEDTRKSKRPTFCGLLPKGPIPFASILFKYEKVCDEKKQEQKSENPVVNQFKGKEKMKRPITEEVQRKKKVLCQKKSGQTLDIQGLLNEDSICYREIEFTNYTKNKYIIEDDD